MDMSHAFITSLANWNVPSLKAELRRLGLDYAGDKTTLVLRLQDHYERQVTCQQSQGASRIDISNPSVTVQNTPDPALPQLQTPIYENRVQADESEWCNVSLLVQSVQTPTASTLGNQNTRLCDSSLMARSAQTPPGTVVNDMSGHPFRDSTSNMSLHRQINAPRVAETNPFISTRESVSDQNGFSREEIHIDPYKTQTHRLNQFPVESEQDVHSDKSSQRPLYQGEQSMNPFSNILHSTRAQYSTHGLSQQVSPRRGYTTHSVPDRDNAVPQPVPDTFHHGASMIMNQTNPFLAGYQPPELSNSTFIFNPPNQSHSCSPDVDELSSLKRELQILKTKVEIQAVSQRLSCPPDTLRSSQLDSSNAQITSMLSLVKKSVDIHGLPPAKPMVFTGDPLEYPQWKSSFDLLIEDKDLSAAQKFSYLRSYLSGKALKCIQGYVMFNTDDAYTEARKSLEERFGDPFEIADAFRDKLESWPRIGDSESEALREYADFLRQCNLAMGKIPELDKLNDGRELKHLVSCLPTRLITRWSREAGIRKLKSKRNPIFSEYAEFVMTEALLACDKTTSFNALVAKKKDSTKPTARGEGTKSTVNLTTLVNTTQHSNTAPPYCSNCRVTKTHLTAECRQVAKLSYEDLQKFMKKENICFKCLGSGHISSDCTSEVKCLIKGCGENHPTCTHRHRSYARNNQKLSENQKSADQDKHVTVHSAEVNTIGVLRHDQVSIASLTSTIIPVLVSSSENPDHEILTYALVDSMADSSIVKQELCDSLSTVKERKKLRISTVTSTNKTVWCDKICNLRVRGIRALKSDTITVPTLFAQPDIPANKDHIPTPDTAFAWSHLGHIKDCLVPLQDCDIGLIIGYNCSAASLPLKTVREPRDITLPYAVQTILGWSVVGGNENSENLRMMHRISIQELSSQEVLKHLEEDLTVAHNTPSMSQNDLLFLKKMDESVAVSQEGFYSMDLPFRNRPSLPDNRSYVMKRFKSLESRLKSNEHFKLMYTEFMKDILSKGEAEIAKATDTDGWYIPHFGVLHPHKPDKLRVVFDCSASYKRQSLNKHLMQGPDLNNSLAGVLCRFRKEQIAVTCDIKKMFHQFRVSEGDRKFLKFLWYEADSNNIADYQMNVHLFGAVSSPSCAIYGLKKIADDYKSAFPRASDFVKNNFYVDDGLVSVASPQEAIQLMTDCRLMLSKGNLVLHKFLSNNEQVAVSLGCEPPTTKLLAADQQLDRALGLCWDVKTDVFVFSEVPIKSSSRRGILSTVASLFDPLGFLTPYTLKGKLLLQSLCYDNKGWDDPLSPDQEKEWDNWTSAMSNLSNIQIKRCFPSATLNSSYMAELHLFSDASTSAYGVCAYLRLVDKVKGESTVSLVMGKSRVAPKKKVVTIPRLELQAATLAVKVGGFLQKELQYPGMACHYWTDSETVLGYIGNETKRFHLFVFNRIQRIRETTSPENWHYIPTTDNPADVASRGSDLKNIPKSWFNGPEFLSQSDFTNPETPLKQYPLHDDDPEVKKVFVNTTSCHVYKDILSSILIHSSWEKVARLMSIILRATTKDKTGKDFSTKGHLVTMSLVRLVQRDHYMDEINKLEQDQPVLKSSPLYKLDVFLDKDSVLRVGGRLQDAVSPFNIKHPAVLPGKSVATKLYVYMKHKEAAHQGKTTTLNAIRASGIYVVNGGKLVSSICHNCVKCLRLRGQPVSQRMANLSPPQVTPCPPFTHTGMDVFGPLYVKHGRKDAKRYGLLFTCLASRGVHIELLEDMSADCFIISLRSFLAIRGPVSVLYSDRGTNFVGAKAELEREISKDNVKKFMTNRQCQFKFNVPAASHMGGTWERMIRTVRNVLNGILIESNTCRLDSCSLRSLFYECMYIVNSRPLTTQQLAGDNSVEPIPLTPNHLLTMKQDTLSPPGGEFSEADLYSRKRWRRVQYLVQQFWSRWKLEYLQDLQKRTKWNQKQRNFKVNDIVLLVEDDLPRSQWRLARIRGIVESRDGLVRKVQIATGSRTLMERGVHKLILLVPSDTTN